MTDRQCVQMLDNGTQCRAWALQGCDKCFSHADDNKEAKMLAVQKGGAVRKAVVETPLQEITINTPTDIVKLLSQTIVEVRSGTLDPRIANTIGFLAGHLVRAFELAVVDSKTEEVKALITHKVSTAVRKGLYD